MVGSKIIPPLATTGFVILAESIVTLTPSSAGLPLTVSLPSTTFGIVSPNVPSTVAISRFATTSAGTVTVIVAVSVCVGSSILAIV